MFRRLVYLILFVELFVFMDSTHAHSELILQHHEEESTIESIFFLDNQYGWASGAPDKLLLTTNGGANWEKISFSYITERSIREISFIDRFTGFCMQMNPESHSDRRLYSLYKTNDGGYSWKKINSLPDSVVQYSFYDEMNGWAGGYLSWGDWWLKHTADGGKTWETKRIGDEVLNQELLDIVCENENVCWLLHGDYGYHSEKSYLEVTKNGGNSWEIIQTFTNKPGRIFQDFSKNIIWLAGALDDISLNSPVEGLSYINLNSNIYSIISNTARVRNIVPLNDGALFYFHSHPDYNFNDCILFSNDNGLTFDSISSIPQLYDEKNYWNIQDFTAIDKNIMWFVSIWGDIYQYKPDTVGVGEYKSNSPFLSLFPPSPNPFNIQTSIKYELTERSDVELSVYDANGQKVATLVDSYMHAGKHSAVFDGANLASGVYFYRLESTGFAKSGKMLLIK